MGMEMCLEIDMIECERKERILCYVIQKGEIDEYLNFLLLEKDKQNRISVKTDFDIEILFKNSVSHLELYKLFVS